MWRQHNEGKVLSRSRKFYKIIPLQNIILYVDFLFPKSVWGNKSRNCIGRNVLTPLFAIRTRNKLNLQDEPIEQFELPVDYDETENIISPKKKKSDEPTNIAHVTRHDDVTNDHVTASSVDDDVRSHVTVDDDVTWKQWVNGLMNQGEVAPRLLI